MDQRHHRRITEECLQLLSRHDIEINPAVRDVITYFFSTEGHLCSTDIAAYAKTRGHAISALDIEEALALLVTYGFAHARVFGDGSTRYEHLHLNTHHDHLFCLKCGRITEFFSPPLEELQKGLAHTHGFHAFSHHMQIHGLCSECFGSDAPQPLSQVDVGGQFRIVEVRPHGRGMARRLHETGLAPGQQGEVIQNRGGIIVLHMGNSRLALRRGQCRHILVSLDN